MTLAYSELAPKGSIYKYQRVYDPTPPPCSPRSSGSTPSSTATSAGVEAQYNSYLTPHTRPAKTLRDLLVNRTVVDNVTLTIDTKLQSQVAAALDQHAPGVLGAAAVVLNPTTGAIEAMYSNPTYDPNPLVSQNLATETEAWNINACPPTADQAACAPGDPLVPGTYGQVYPPGSSFKVVTASAVLEDRPRPGQDDLPGGSLGGPAQFGHAPPGPDQLPRRTPGRGGNLEALLIQSCDADFAQIGQLLGAQALVNQAEAYGFNQRIPLDVPRTPWPCPTSGPPP